MNRAERPLAIGVGILLALLTVWDFPGSSARSWFLYAVSVATAMMLLYPAIGARLRAHARLYKLFVIVPSLSLGISHFLAKDLRGAELLAHALYLVLLFALYELLEWKVLFSAFQDGEDLLGACKRWGRLFALRYLLFVFLSLILATIGITFALALTDTWTVLLLGAIFLLVAILLVRLSARWSSPSR
ncbi:MAG: hypothetical protein HZB92_03975 [Euryarchaeota archaeon]|nr:hypothetical protein [Euryarchaeota archaeon]